MIAIVVAEAEERRAAADLIEATRPVDARRLRREAALLRTMIQQPGAE